MNGDIEARLRSDVDALPRGLRDHILRVEAEAIRLGERHRVDARHLRIAALGHDIVRHLSGAELLQSAERYGYRPDAVERAVPILTHGPVASRMLSRDYSVGYPEVLAAVDCHTTARPGMSRFEKLVFLADKIEPEKLERHKKWQSVRDLAEGDLDAAVLQYLNLHIERAIEKGWLLHQRTIEARNQLLGR